jgi:hypothetical protein
MPTPTATRTRIPNTSSWNANGVEIELHRYVINRDRSATSKVLEQWAAEELQAANCRQAAIGDATATLPSLTFDTVYWHGITHVRE